MNSDTGPYFVGNVLQLKLHGDEFDSDQAIEAQITKIFEPFTVSPVMQVSIDAPKYGLSGLMVLKLYDRRFSPHLRCDQRAPTWSTDIERQFVDFIQSDAATEYFAALESEDDVDDTPDDDEWKRGKDEADMRYISGQLCNDEVGAYERLKDVQGTDVPAFKARVELSVDSSTYPDLASQFLVVPGILIEFIDGFALKEIATNSPQQCWQKIGDDAIRVVNLLCGRGVLNKDVSLRNFIVRRIPTDAAADCDYKAFMIDFGYCEFRSPDQSDEDWRELKWDHDEEGAVGYVLQHILQGRFVYKMVCGYLGLWLA